MEKGRKTDQKALLTCVNRSPDEEVMAKILLWVTFRRKLEKNGEVEADFRKKEEGGEGFRV